VRAVVVPPVGEVRLSRERRTVWVRPEAHNAHLGDPSKGAAQVAHHQGGLHLTLVVEEYQYANNRVVSDVRPGGRFSRSVGHHLQALLVDAADVPIGLERTRDALPGPVLGG